MFAAALLRGLFRAALGFLRREEGWLTIGVIRASEVHKLHGGYSSVARALLRFLFLGSDGVSTAGVAVHLFGSPRLLYFRFEKRFIRSMSAVHLLDTAVRVIS